MRYHTSLFSCVLTGTLAAIVSSGAAAQTYPAKAVRMVLPYAAGGGSDTMSRALAQKLNESMGQPFIVENRPGAGGIPGTEVVARATPDGYTLLVTASAHTILPSIGTKLPFDAVADFAPITQLTSQAYVFGINPGVPAKSVMEFIALAKAKPGSINYGSGGNGNATHIGVELLKSMAGIDMVHIPYKGGAPATLALMSGEVSLLFSTVGPTVALIKSGKVRALAVTSLQRSSALPDVPTVSEAGLPGFEVTSWYAILAPARTPAPIVNKLHAEIVKGMNTPDMKARVAKDGSEYVGSTPEAFTKYLNAEVIKWANVIKTANIKFD